MTELTAKIAFKLANQHPTFTSSWSIIKKSSTEPYSAKGPYKLRVLVTSAFLQLFSHLNVVLIPHLSCMLHASLSLLFIIGEYESEKQNRFQYIIYISLHNSISKLSSNINNCFVKAYDSPTAGGSMFSAPPGKQIFSCPTPFFSAFTLTCQNFVPKFFRNPNLKKKIKGRKFVVSGIKQIPTGILI